MSSRLVIIWSSNAREQGRPSWLACGSCSNRIELMPAIYAPIWQEVRAARLKQYPFVVYYRVLADRVEVLAVMHGSRDWSAWQSRV